MISNNDPVKEAKIDTSAPVTELKQPPTVAAHVHEFQTFLQNEGILEEWDETDVVLEAANGDEIPVGTLTATERKWFCLGQLLNQIIRDELVEIEAAQTDLIGKIMRERKVNGAAAVQVLREEHSERLPEDQRIFLNTANICATMALSTFDYSIRARLHLWDQSTIVRRGFKLHKYA